MKLSDCLAAVAGRGQLYLAEEVGLEEREKKETASHVRRQRQQSK